MQAFVTVIGACWGVVNLERDLNGKHGQAHAVVSIYGTNCILLSVLGLHALTAGR